MIEEMTLIIPPWTIFEVDCPGPRLIQFFSQIHALKSLTISISSYATGLNYPFIEEIIELHASSPSP
jgi:hypothetical protein